MNGIWILLLLILTSALPVIVVFFFLLKVKKKPLSLPWFLMSLTAGIISLLAAALIQGFFPRFNGAGQEDLWPVFFGIFVRIALVEEASRFVTLVPLIKAGAHRRHRERTFSAALGLVAGLGFAMIENAFYGTADINITLLRAFSAAPLHGACGIRAGTAVFMFRRHTVKALGFFISAVLIHGAYNLMIVNPVLPPILAVPVAFAAFFASLYLLKAADTDDKNIFISNPDP